MPCSPYTSGNNHISFSADSNGSRSFQDGLRQKKDGDLKTMLKDPNLSPEERSGVLNEMANRKRKDLDPDEQKKLDEVMKRVKNGTASEDDMDWLADLFGLDKDDLNTADKSDGGPEGSHEGGPEGSHEGGHEGGPEGSHEGGHGPKDPHDGGHEGGPKEAGGGHSHEAPKEDPKNNGIDPSKMQYDQLGDTLKNPGISDTGKQEVLDEMVDRSKTYYGPDGAGPDQSKADRLNELDAKYDRGELTDPKERQEYADLIGIDVKDLPPSPNEPPKLNDSAPPASAPPASEPPASAPPASAPPASAPPATPAPPDTSNIPVNNLTYPQAVAEVNNPNTDPERKKLIVDGLARERIASLPEPQKSELARLLEDFKYGGFDAADAKRMAELLDMNIDPANLPTNA